MSSLLNAQTANRAYATRPADERFPSLQALVDFSKAEKNLSRECRYSLRDLRAIVTNEHAQFVPQDSTSPEGKLMLCSPKSIAKFTHWSFTQLARTVGAPAAYLRELPPQLAADCLNYGMHEASAAATDVNILARAANGDPTATIRACTSETYGRLWDVDLYAALQETIVGRDARWTTPPTWTGEPAGVYRGDRDSFVCLVNGGSIVNDPSASNDNRGGEMFRGLLIRNSEVGAAAVTIESILFRYICGNHMIWGAILDKQFRRRHVGMNTLRDTVREISRIAWNFTNVGAARDEAIIKLLIEKEIAHTKEAVIDELRALGATKEQAQSAYDRCERTEQASPRSFWGVAQGLTRISQEETNQDARYVLDRIAALALAKGARLVHA